MQPQHAERSLEQMVFRDGVNRYTLKPAASFADPALALLLYRLADPALPRLFGRTGVWNDEPSPWLTLPLIDPETIGLTAYPAISRQALLVFEHVNGTPLSEVDSFGAADAMQLHRTFKRLRVRLRDIAGKSVMHLDLKPSNCILTESGSFCFIDWASGRLGEGPQEPAEGTAGFVPKSLPFLAVPARDDFALAQTLLALLADKPAADLHLLDRYLAMHKLPHAFRKVLKHDLTYGRTRLKRRTFRRAKRHGQATQDGKMTVIVIPWDEAAEERNIRISVDGQR